MTRTHELQPLAPRQRDTLLAVCRFIAANGWAPTVGQIAEMTQAKGRNSVHAVVQHLKALERKGYILRGDGTEARAIYVYREGYEAVGQPVPRILHSPGPMTNPSVQFDNRTAVTP